MAAQARAAPLTGWLDGMGSAAVALDAGDGEAAEAAARGALAAIPAGRAGARAHLPLGLAQAARQRPAEAAASLKVSLESLPAALRPAVLERLGAALGRAGHPRGAAEALAEALSTAPAADRPRLAVARARALLADGRPGPAAGVLEAAGDDGPAATLALAEVRLAARDERARPLLVRLAVQEAATPEGDAAAALLEAGPEPLSPSDRLARAERLLASARPAAARAEIDRAAPDAPAARTALLRGVALLQLGRPAEAEEAVRAVAAGRDGDAAAARWVLARAASRQGRLLEAAERYRGVAADRPTVPGLSAGAQADLADDAAYLSAWLLYDAGRFAEAAPGLERFARERPRARRAPEARWFRAWTLHRAGDLEGARAALRDLAAAETGPYRSAALYWRARIATGAEAAEALYRAAVEEAPDGWYALLAARRLEALGLAPPPALEPPPGPPPAPATQHAEAAALALSGELLGAGLRPEGMAVLQRLSRERGVRDRATRLAELAAFAGDAEIPYRMARDHLPPTLRSRRWAFPEATAAGLGAAARALGVDPSLARAVARRESAFVASARSAAAAEGLLQLRPPTAARLGEVLGLPPLPDGALLDPGENVPLGVAYLGLLLSRFGAVPAALAAYNAGPVPASAWARDLAGRPLDEWVEDLPYRETRQYVRGVVADWVRYRRLQGDPPPALDPAQPVRPPGDGVAF